MDIVPVNGWSCAADSVDPSSPASHRNVSTAQPPARLGVSSAVSSQNVAAHTTPAATLSRRPRGVGSSQCAADSVFRECRGGDALNETAQSYEKFDQHDYRRTRGEDQMGSAQGVLREAMRRIDRDSKGATDLLSAVRLMADEAASGSHASSDMFDRIDAFQYNRATLGFRRFTGRAVLRFTDIHSRDNRIVLFMDNLQGRLQPGEMAYLRLGTHSTAVMNSAERDHALLVQRRASGDFVAFDPDNGAFLYRNEADLLHALRSYIDAAFHEEGREVVPASMSIFTPRTSGGSAEADAEVNGEVNAEAEVHGGKPLEPHPVPDDLPVGLSGDRHQAELYSRTSTEADGLSHDTLSAAAGSWRVMAANCAGLSVYAVREIAAGGSSDMLAAIRHLRDRLSDPQTRHDAIEEVEHLQEENQYTVVADVPRHIRHDGQIHLERAEALRDDLAIHFGSPYFRDNGLRGYQNDFVEIGLTYRGTDEDDSSERNSGESASTSSGQSIAAREGHSIIVQRVHPSADYRNDEYQLYDPNVGVFRYRDFDQMSSALMDLHEYGYPDEGGVESATTTWFANLDLWQPPHRLNLPNLSADRESPINNVTLRDIASQPVLVPPRADPPPEPDGAKASASHSDLRKRSIDVSGSRQPYALFRPSTATPDALKTSGGFSSRNTPLRDISLDLHHFDVAANPALTDSAGYLATFRSGRAALQRLSAQSQDGYIYYVAPTPNMVDLDASLGNWTGAPATGELAAMGHIEYTQIRGWNPVKNGVVLPYVRNPDFRWDVYDQTQTAGAQPQLARFAIDSDAWQDSAYKPFVMEVAYQRKFATLEPKQDPNLTQAEFYGQATRKIQYLAERQARGLDYRGPTTLRAYGGNDTLDTQLYVDEGNNVYVNSSYAASTRYAGNTRQFVMGEDGRFHLGSDNDKVLRVGSDGYLYVGSVPADRFNRNGVFAFDGTHLVHQEDQKFLTVGKSAFTPFVTTEDYGSRSDWKLTDPGGQAVTPPRTNMHTFWASSAGDRFQLYAFDRDPDVALPAGVTQFVTRMPGIDYQDSFGRYVPKVSREDVAKASQWLARNNAAWLFRDGFYAVPRAANQIEVRKLDGTPVWRSDVDQGPGVDYSKWPDARTSSYRIPDETWDRIKGQETWRQQLEDKLKNADFLRTIAPQRR